MATLNSENFISTFSKSFLEDNVNIPSLKSDWIPSGKALIDVLFCCLSYSSPELLKVSEFISHSGLKSAFVKFQHLRNAYSEMFSKLGAIIFVSILQFWKAISAILVTIGSLTSRRSQDLKAILIIFFAWGMLISVNLRHLKKALVPIISALGIVTLHSISHSQKASSRILVALENLIVVNE